MFFKNKYIIDCILECIDRHIIYYIDQNDKNKSICEYKFKFVEPESYKKLYTQDEKSNLYQIDKKYKAKFNEKDESFIILKEI